MKQREHELQAACIRWFDLQYPQHRHRLFAIPNGGQRSIATARKLKAEGVRAGVWDLFLAIPTTSGRIVSLGNGWAELEGRKAGLFIEMKAGKNGLTDSQKAFQEANQYAYAFAVCRSLDKFMQTIKEYLK